MKKLMMLLFIGLTSASINVLGEDNKMGEDEIVFTDVLNGKEIVRHENYLVYYKYNATGKTTANQWGYEISVDENNYVVEAATNVTVYSGGYAISGHGIKKDLLMMVQIGDIVEINHDTLVITVKRNPILSAAFLVEKNRNEANLLYESALSGFYSFDQTGVTELLADIESEYVAVNAMLGKGDLTPDEVASLKTKAERVQSLAAAVKYRTVKSEPLEIRGLWHRPNGTAIAENNLAGVKEFVGKVKELGFNTIYVETFWNGYVSYRSEIAETHPLLSTYYYGDEYQYDYIKAFTTEAKKAGIAVFAWCHIFNAGSNLHKSSVIKDEWLVSDYQGRTLHPNAYGGSYYMDPSHPEVLAFVEAVTVEMIQKYDFTGIQFDYIRYYDNDYSAQPIRDSGFGLYAENKFKEAYGLEGDVRTLIKSASVREQWHEWRQNNITNAVRRLSAAGRSAKEDVYVAAAVVANVNVARNTYMQDWPAWVGAGDIDLLCPMIYSGSVDAVAGDAAAIKNRITNLSFFAPGIAPLYYGYDVDTNLRQIDAVNPFGGASSFASQNIIGNSDAEISLRDGIYRIDSISPFAETDVLMAVAMDDIKTYYAGYKDAGMTGYDILKTKIDAIIEMKCNNPADWQAVMEQLNHLSLLTAYLDNEAVAVNLKNKIARLTDVLDIKISREMIKLGYYDPTAGNRPDPASFDYPTAPLPSDPDDGNKEKKKGCFGFNSVMLFGLCGFLYFKRKELFVL